MKKFTFCSFKGGTGKTSTSMHIGACIAKFHKKRVLLLDFDSQANLSIGLGVDIDNFKTMVPVLQKQACIHDVIHPTSIGGLYIIPANSYLDGIENTPELAYPYAHERLRNVLQNLENEFDFCFIDTPPSLGWLTQSAFFASNYIVVCVVPEAYSIIGLRRLRDFQNSIFEYHEIKTFGVILSFWDERGAFNKEFLEEINRYFPDKVFIEKIRRDVSVSRAVLKGQPVFNLFDKSRASEDYIKITKEFMLKFDLNESK